MAKSKADMKSLFRSCSGFKKLSGSAPYTAPQPPCHMLEASLSATYLGLKADKDLDGCCPPPSPTEGSQAWSLVDAVKTTSKARTEADLFTARGINLDTTTCTTDTQSLLATPICSSHARYTPNGPSTPESAEKAIMQRRRRYARQALKARREYGRRLEMRTLAFV